MVATVIRLLSHYDGTLCRYIVDDNGSSFLVAFGLPPAKHENDPLRAVKMALATVDALAEQFIVAR